MGLSVDSRSIVRAWVVPWEPAVEDALATAEWGVAYETTNGLSGADRIGKKAQAQAIVRDITRQREQSFGESMSKVSRIRG